MKILLDLIRFHFIKIKQISAYFIDSSVSQIPYFGLSESPMIEQSLILITIQVIATLQILPQIVDILNHGE